MFRRSVGDTSKQPYFHLSACRRSSGAGIQSAIQGEWVFTRRIEDCAKPPAPGVSQAALTSNYAEDPSIHPLFQEHLSERLHQRTSSFTGVIAPEADLRARSLVNREADGYGLISATLFELGEAGAVVSTEVAV